MSHTIGDQAEIVRKIIIDSQHLSRRSDKSIEEIVSDICGLQYDPNPTIHLNQYMMLWNRKKDFTAEQLDIAAYKEFKVIETFAFKRNLFFVPYDEFALYHAAAKRIVRWGSSDESWLRIGDNPEDQTAESQLKESLTGQQGMTAKQIWEHLNLSFEWNKYRREHDQNYNLPLFRAFYRLVRKRELLTCGRNPGTFREPVYILKEIAGITDRPNQPIDDKQAITWMVEKLIASFGVTDPVHISHISGFATVTLSPIFQELVSEKKILQIPYKIGRKYYYIHSSKAHLLNAERTEDSDEVRLISPMDTLVRDQTWLKTFFDYSYTFEYFKKKGMKWPLSILVGNRFVGYLDCKMEWGTKKFIIKEKNIFDSDFQHHKGIELAIQDLAAFHGAKEIIEKK
ncbi:MAG TPA: crosslink repair DNA glycosylase YcaQ family protein [Oscillospiraceae bacterium]|nr:crosslink repair DNA glycosylase YcaQ family protein [Oscillospiraceae bacterium]HPS34834.1 crosslink repair DNA glycosylase YcaQ family protein [Oscillospiraceae bacterium]